MMSSVNPTENEQTDAACEGTRTKSGVKEPSCDPTSEGETKNCENVQAEALAHIPRLAALGKYSVVRMLPGGNAELIQEW